MRKISLEFLNEESVGSCEERISREVMFKVVEDSLNGGVEADEGLRMVVNHERSPLDKRRSFCLTVATKEGLTDDESVVGPRASWRVRQRGVERENGTNVE